MTMQLNPPPGWPQVPADWVPPQGWQPDPSWPAPPPGWQLWTEAAGPRAGQVRAAQWTIAGGAAVFLGSLLPFLASSQPDLYQISSAPKDTATFFGIVLAVLGAIMLVQSRRARLISGILTLIVAGLTELTLLGVTVAGLVGTDESDGFGSVHVNFSPEIGIVIAILGCAAAGIGAIISFRRR